MSLAQMSPKPAPLCAPLIFLSVGSRIALTHRDVIPKSVFFPRMCDRNGGRRLRQWLIEQIDSSMYPGLIWESEEKTLFRIPWKHAGKQDYNQEVDASIFKVQSPAPPRPVSGFPLALEEFRNVL